MIITSMKYVSVFVVACIVSSMIFGIARTVRAQQLEPRAYSPSPVGTNFLGLGYLYSSGGLSLDPTLPVTNVHAKVSTFASYYGRTFDFFGHQASVTATTSYNWYTAYGDVNETSRSIDRSGFGDPALRFAVNLIGGPVLKPQEFFQHKPETILGASLVIVAPLGQYDPSKAINLGTNRWSFKPELGLSQPVGNWAFEVYAGVWLFTGNDNYFGGQVRRQDPLQSYQAHVIYNFFAHMWTAFDFTYYVGGATTVNGNHNNDRQDNTRIGLTFSAPVTQNQSLKLIWSNGATTRIGSSFETLGVFWQWTWF
jgi:outer membrane putative beta-barrel porin/alpha-amylase